MARLTVVAAIATCLALLSCTSAWAAQIVASGVYVDDATGEPGPWEATFSPNGQDIAGAVILSAGKESGTMMLRGTLDSKGVRFDFTTLGGEPALFDGSFSDGELGGRYSLGDRGGHWSGKYTITLE